MTTIKRKCVDCMGSGKTPQPFMSNVYEDCFICGGMGYIEEEIIDYNC